MKVEVIDYDKERLMKQIFFMYFEEKISVEKIVTVLKTPSIRMVYNWIKKEKNKRSKIIELSLNEIKDLKDVKPSPGFKTSAEELKYYRLLNILPRLIDELKKKDNQS